MLILVQDVETIVADELVERMIGPQPPPGYNSNGNGPAWLRGFAWLVPDHLIGGIDLTLAGHYHDWGYSLGGSARARRDADLMFRTNLETLMRLQHAAAWRTWLVPRIYFTAVRLLGRRSFGR